MTFHQHWRNLPAHAWHWPNFSPAEIACRGTGKLVINEDALDRLQALRAALSGGDAENPLDEAAASADRVTAALDGTSAAAGRAGAAVRSAGEETRAGAEAAATGWAAVSETLADYAAKAREIGGDIGQALVGAFRGAENAIGEFVKTGKLKFGDLVTSLIADLAKLAARRFILGPLAGVLSGVLGNLGGGIFANILYAGGMVDAAGPGRMVPALAFAGAPRMHSGGWAGLRPDEVPAILQRGERVLSRREAAGYGNGGNVTVNINARDAESFRLPGSTKPSLSSAPIWLPTRR